MIKDPNAEDYSNFDEAISDSEDEVSYGYLRKERSMKIILYFIFNKIG